MPEQPEPLPRQVSAQIQGSGSPAGKGLGSNALGGCGLSHSSVLAIQHALVKPCGGGLRSRTSTLLITACSY